MLHATWVGLQVIAVTVLVTTPIVYQWILTIGDAVVEGVFTCISLVLWVASMLGFSCNVWPTTANHHYWLYMGLYLIGALIEGGVAVLYFDRRSKKHPQETATVIEKE